MYLGPGAGPMLAAASAWDMLAAELFIAATGYSSVVTELASYGWLGPSSTAMVTAAMRYSTWLHSTAMQAERTATQARVAAAAYELAFAMTVPPPVVAANRSLLIALIASNFFGQNTPAIAATEAHYAEMWLQDAAAMYGYAESSAAASQLTPFTQPPPTTDPAGSTAQTGTVAQGAVQQLVSPATLTALVEHVPNITNSVLSTSNAVASGRGIWATNTRLAFQAGQEAARPLGFGAQLVSVAPAGGGGSTAATVSATLGRATQVGKLSTPPGWLSSIPSIQPAALAAPYPGGQPISAASAEISPTPGNVLSQSVLGTLSRDGPPPPRHKSKPIIVRSPAAG